ncbi:VanZ family protein [Tundrisphaera lichenicola]|uniref:VanZ family protein n=1 Tax=Tundrisphaera lichenicola TaxID=2029860 RepID=UPI003EC074EB
MSTKAGWASMFVAVVWCGLIFGSSSTVILPHQFFAWIASNLLPDRESFRQFTIFWGIGWFAIVKGWHAAEYAILFVFICKFLDFFAGSRRRVDVLLAFSFCVLFAASDEYHQTFVPGRGGTWTDVLIDTSGAGLAALIAYRRRADGRRVSPDDPPIVSGG